MLTRSLIGQRLVALFALGWLLFNFPLLALFNDAGAWFGIPSLYAYLFGAWALFIAALAYVVERKTLAKARLPATAFTPHLKD